MPAGSASANVASGRYLVYGEIASGGMATIQYGRLVGPAGFSRAVAIKRLHPQFAKDQHFVAMFLDEARLSARISHANVVQTLDVLSEPGDLAVVMEYVHGESLARLFDRLSSNGAPMTVRIAVSLLAGVLHGLHAAHETRGEQGESLHIVHRDVSPENILLGSDGVARVLDFGIARAQGRSRITPAGELKGKLAYMSCEQYCGQEVDRRADVYGASVVLWEALAGRVLFRGESDAAVVGAVMNHDVEPPSRFAPVPPALDAIVLRGLARDRNLRFASAREMALALEREVGVAPQSEVSDWLEHVAGDLLAERTVTLRRLQQQSSERPALRESELPGTRRIEGGPRANDTPTASPWSHAPTPGQASESGWRLRPSSRRGLRLGLLVSGCSAVALGFWFVSVAPRSASMAPPFEAGAREPAALPAAPSPNSEPASPNAPAAPAEASEPATERAGAAGAATTERARARSPRSAQDRAARASRASAAASAGENAADAGKKREQARRGEADVAKAAPAKASATKAQSAKKPAETDCSQPFVTDGLGIRRIRRECLD